MAAFNKANGIYSAKLGLYMYALALQMALGYCMLLCSPNKLNISAIVASRQLSDIRDIGFDVLQGAGAVHVVLAVLTFGFLILTHFVTICFKIPMLVLTVVQTAYCSATASICAVYLQKGNSFINKTFQIFAKTVVGVVDPKLNDLLVENRNFLFLIGLLSVIAASLFHKAQMVKGTDSATQVMVVVPSISLGLGIAFALCAPCCGYRTFSLGLLWSLTCIVGDVISSVSRFFCFKPLKIIMLAVHALIVLLSVVTIGVCTTIYTGGKIDYSGYLAILHGEVQKLGDTGHALANYQNVTSYLQKITDSYSDETLNLLMGNGVYFIVIVVLSIVCLLFGILSLLYSVFRFFDRSRDSVESDAANTQGMKIVVS
ncbi:membrane protein, putative [Babesia bigemina]|uniref:Membrane protein, putative n=1 Tax=Babesia bigemina TaxID=5866 RepID=A0A061DDI5_BABBI|nr:membrane protein, putative [Babesia bigemina]CDR97444.1 membrane protein, putative [Babesia bigemina]|eukprot:XP_012769630.1 membrane protein, putative [Babesia bigemina]